MFCFRMSTLYFLLFFFVSTVEHKSMRGLQEAWHPPSVCRLSVNFRTDHDNKQVQQKLTHNTIQTTTRRLYNHTKHAKRATQLRQRAKQCNIDCNQYEQLEKQIQNMQQNNNINTVFKQHTNIQKHKLHTDYKKPLTSVNTATNNYGHNTQNNTKLKPPKTQYKQLEQKLPTTNTEMENN